MTGAHRAGAPKQRLLDQISAQQQAGSLSATDADALTGAVQDIDQSISGASGTGSSDLAPSQAKGRMDDLIGAEVDKGTLTSDQATTLKGMLSSHGAGDRHGGPGGAPPADAVAATGSADATSGSSSASDLLSSFLKQLQDGQNQTQASGYGGSGTAATSAQARVFDFKV
ncbi:hypothetical protein [Methylobacterium platani]|nr:hypothetical protein [Methylobacterium platani]KMO18786.1 hypothetical protein SQ03_09600 [Methylobacterium platani JCM 14648]